MPPVDAHETRCRNETRVRRALLRLRQATRAQLSKETGLSQTAVGAALSSLHARGEVESHSGDALDEGRSAALYRYRGESQKAGAVAIAQWGERHLVRLEVYDLFGDLAYQSSQVLEEVRLESLDRMLGLAFERIEGIDALALGLPAQVEGDAVLFCEHPALVGKKLSRRLESLYHVPVLLENDINAAVLGYVNSLPQRDVPPLTAGVYFPRRNRPGMGLALGRRLWPGRRGFVGEFHYLRQGAQWPQVGYNEAHTPEEAAVDLLTTVCAVAGPQRAVLYGRLFRPGDGDLIRRQVEERFLYHYGLEVVVRGDLWPDFSAGMRALALGQLERLLFGEGAGE